MDKILSNLTDPSWWFSAVFIAIVASLIASFVKDPISGVLSKVSQSYRVRQERRKKEIDDLAEIVHKDGQLAAFHQYQATKSYVYAMANFVLYTIAFLFQLTGMAKGITSTEHKLMFYLVLGGSAYFTFVGVWRFDRRHSIVVAVEKKREELCTKKQPNQAL